MTNYRKGKKQTETDRNGQKRTETDGNGQKVEPKLPKSSQVQSSSAETELDRNGQKQTQTDRDRKKWTEINRTGLKRT